MQKTIRTKIAIILLILLTLTSSTQTPLYAAEKSPTHDYVILWDIHEVIIEKDFTKIMAAIWNYNKKLAVLFNLNFSLLWNLARLIVDAIISDGLGEAFVQTAHANNNPALAQLINDIANAQRPIQGETISTYHIIQALKQMGFKQYIGSNIGVSIFADLVTTSDVAYIFQDNLELDLHKSQVVTYDPDHPERTIKKPDKRFFTSFFEKNNISHEEARHIIFIDDRLENIKSAQELGMQTIHFTSPEQLAHELEEILNIKLAAIFSFSLDT